MCSHSATCAFHILMPWVTVSSECDWQSQMFSNKQSDDSDCALHLWKLHLQVFIVFVILIALLPSSSQSWHVLPDHPFRCRGPSASPTVSTRRSSRWCCPSCHTSPSATWKSQRKLAASTWAWPVSSRSQCRLAKTWNQSNWKWCFTADLCLMYQLLTINCLGMNMYFSFQCSSTVKSFFLKMWDTHFSCFCWQSMELQFENIKTSPKLLTALCGKIEGFIIVL